MMLNKVFWKMMKNDKELQELRKQVYAITGRLEDISFRVGANYTYEEWKEQFRKIIREQLARKEIEKLKKEECI